MYSLDVKNLAVKLYLEKYHSLRRTADALQISKSSIHRWVRSFPALRRTWKARRDHARIERLVLELLNADPFHTAASLRRALESKLGHIVSEKLARKMVRGLQWTRKKVFHTAVPGPLQKSKEDLFCRESLGLCDWIAIDETSIALNMQPLYGYSPKNRRLTIPAKSLPRYQRFSLVMAITRSQVICYKWISGSFNTQSFVQFLSELPDQFRGYPVLMDNVAFHRTQAVREELGKRQMRPLFIPPYSPQCNPIENAFSVFKNHFRKLFAVECITERVGLAVRALTAAKLDAFYVHMEKHVSCLREKV